MGNKVKKNDQLLEHYQRKSFYGPALEEMAVWLGRRKESHYRLSSLGPCPENNACPRLPPPRDGHLDAVRNSQGGGSLNLTKF